MQNRFAVQIELDRTLKPADVDVLHAELEDFHPSVSESVSRNIVITLSVYADSVRMAVTVGLALTAQFGTPLGVTALPEAVRDQRAGLEPIPEMLSVTEVAAMTGTSRQAVLQRIASRSLPATKVGRDYAIPASAVAQEGR